jgi:peroxiredoxin
MRELGQLEERHRDFEERDARVVAVSLDGPEDAKKTHDRFQNLRVVADRDGSLIRPLGFLHEGAHGPSGEETAAPTTVLIDRQGVVRWLYRADRYIERLPPRQLLEAMEKYLPRPNAGKD